MSPSPAKGTIVCMCGHQRFRSACACAHGLIIVFDRLSMGSQGSNVSSDGKLRLKSDCADVQTDMNLCCMHKPTCTLCWIPARF